ncbi:MAG: DUF6867 family protein [bacterium]|jgi:branched-chain amino acid transport system ATP-binding protein
MDAGIWVFLIFTVLIAGGASWLMGQAIASTWRPVWQCVAYGLLLGAAERFMVFSLFEGELLSLTAYLVDTVVLIAIALISFRGTMAQKLVQQYPWRYERSGMLGWKEKGTS